MTILIIIALLVVLLAGWVMSTQRRLVVMDENINNAMSQIGVQLSSRFDALTALLDLAKGYAAHESQTLIETIKSRRSVITAKSPPPGRAPAGGRDLRGPGPYLHGGRALSRAESGQGLCQVYGRGGQL